MAEPLIINKETPEQKKERIEKMIAQILEDEHFTIRITHVIDFIPAPTKI